MLDLLAAAQALAKIVTANFTITDRCCICGNPLTEQHHIFPIHLGGPVAGPLVPLCREHHFLIHQLASKIERGQVAEHNFAMHQQAVAQKLIEIIVIASLQSKDNYNPNQPRKLIITLPQELLVKAHKRKFDGGHQSLEAYIIRLLQQDIRNL